MNKEDIINNIKLMILSINTCVQNNALDKAQRIYDFMQDPELKIKEKLFVHCEDCTLTFKCTERGMCLDMNND